MGIFDWNESFWIFYTIPALYGAVTSAVFYVIASVEPTPYIDEIFHVGQCQRYCEGNFFAYDPKLTTPPGLYVITLLTLAPLLKFFSLECSVNALRSINVAASLGLFGLIYKILRNRLRQHSSAEKLWLALNLNTFPVLYFYSFFYYTDVVSTFLVLLTYYLYHTNRSHSAGVAGLLSAAIRQTNVVWFLCFALVKCCENVANRMHVSETDKRRIMYTWVIMKESWTVVRESPFHFFTAYMLRETYLLIVTILTFAWVVARNGSLVLGDKSSHEAVLHVPQLLYFSLFTCGFSFPLCIRPALKLLQNHRRATKYMVACVAVLTVIVAFNTMAHAFLLSDNRHYTFYIWKRVYERPFGKYGVIPFYVISIYCILENTSHLSGYTKLGYLVATALCLVPQKLLEFRYFIIPYLLYRIETCDRGSRWWQLGMEFALNVFVNYLTISFFVTLPFQWPDGTTQRFSW